MYRFKNRQSSLWLVRNMYKRFSCWYLPRGICNKAAVSLLMSGKCWGQTAPKESASLMPSQGIGDIGGRKRKSPTGGAAYGIPRNTSTGSKCLLFKSCDRYARYYVLSKNIYQRNESSDDFINFIHETTVTYEMFGNRKKYLKICGYLMKIVKNV